MNEAEKAIIKEWNGLMSNAVAECLGLRREIMNVSRVKQQVLEENQELRCQLMDTQREKVMLYEMLIESERWEFALEKFTDDQGRSQIGVTRQRLGWTEEEIDRRLRNGRGETD